ncbi:MAG: signal peptidase I [Victivallales bacterium]|nr:signal peptidase I [Victivallales bacterium]
MIFSKKHTLRKELKKLKIHARHTLIIDDDILDDKQKKVLLKIENTSDTCDFNSIEEMQKTINDCNRSYGGILPPAKHAWIRECLDIIAVAVAVAFGIRGLFLQPFKIPTSSMQPTLFGIHYIAEKGNENPLLGKVSAPLDYMLFSCERAQLKVEKAGTLEGDATFRQNLHYGISPYTSFNIGEVNYTLPGTVSKVLEYTGLGKAKDNTYYKAGQELCNGWLSSGDHLFVDRFSHLLVGLNRGDIVVFNTENIYHNGRALAKNGYYYIKRLIGLPGDTLKLENQKIYIRPKGQAEFKIITELSPKFEKLYSNKGGYHGHWNVDFGNDLSANGFEVPKDSYFMMGDNSLNSLDSRYWGTVPRKNIVGKALFIFWPISRRWGLTDRAEPIQSSTDISSLRSMQLQ